MKCKHCGSQALRRMPRVGFLQNRLFPKLDLYPWECADCRKVGLQPSRVKGSGGAGQYRRLSQLPSASRYSIVLAPSSPPIA